MAAYLYHMQVFMYLDKYHGFGNNKFAPINILQTFSLVFLVSTFASLYIEEPLSNYWNKTRKLAINGTQLLP